MYRYVYNFWSVDQNKGGNDYNVVLIIPKSSSFENFYSGHHHPWLRLGNFNSAWQLLGSKAGWCTYNRHLLIVIRVSELRGQLRFAGRQYAIAGWQDQTRKWENFVRIVLEVPGKLKAGNSQIWKNHVKIQVLVHRNRYI